MIEYGRQTKNGLIKNYGGFTPGVFGGLDGVWPFWRRSISHNSPGFDGDPKG